MAFILLPKPKDISFLLKLYMRLCGHHISNIFHVTALHTSGEYIIQYTTQTFFFFEFVILVPWKNFLKILPISFFQISTLSSESGFDNN